MSPFEMPVCQPHWLEYAENGLARKRREVTLALAPVAGIHLSEYFPAAQVAVWAVVVTVMALALIAAIRAQQSFLREELASTPAVLTPDQRPWIRAEAEIASPVRFMENGMEVWIKFTLSNVGRTPALNVAVLGALVRAEHPARMLPRQAEICSAATDQSSGNHFGIRVFQGTTQTIAQQFVMPKELVAGNASDMHAGSVWVEPVLIGCIDYVDTARHEHHQTGFAYRLGALKQEGIFDQMSGNFIVKTIKPIPIGDLSLTSMADEREFFFAN